MYNHKMKPLHSTRSFDSWKSNIEKQVDEGLTFARSEEKMRMPSRFAKHLDLIYKRKVEVVSDEQSEEFVDKASIGTNTMRRSSII